MTQPESTPVAPPQSRPAEPSSCGDCRFWEKTVQRNGPTPAYENFLGECRRFPPTTTGSGEYLAFFPATRNSVWCGEFAPRAEEAAHG